MLNTTSVFRDKCRARMAGLASSSSNPLTRGRFETKEARRFLLAGEGAASTSERETAFWPPTLVIMFFSSVNYWISSVVRFSWLFLIPLFSPSFSLFYTQPHTHIAKSAKYRKFYLYYKRYFPHPSQGAVGGGLGGGVNHHRFSGPTVRLAFMAQHFLTSPLLLFMIPSLGRAAWSTSHSDGCSHGSCGYYCGKNWLLGRIDRVAFVLE